MKLRAGLLAPRARASIRLGSTSAASASHMHEHVAREQGLNMRVCHWRAVRGPRVRASVGRGPSSVTSKTDEWGEVLLSREKGEPARSMHERVTSVWCERQSSMPNARKMLSSEGEELEKASS